LLRLQRSAASSRSARIPSIIPQAAYNSAYNNTFPSNASQYILNIGDTQKTFQPLGYDSGTKAWSLQAPVTIPFEMKAMHDEMGGVYDTMFGRMSGMLGLSNPSSALGFILPFPFSSPPTDVVKGSLESTKIGQLHDGTQIWRIFHNGVDTHPIHTHLFTAQVISRVGQDGQVAQGPFPGGQAVDAQNTGWKDTFFVNPLEITFLALRPTVPTPTEIPFELQDSVRLIDPTLPDGATLPPPGPAGWFDPGGNPIPQILNHTVNFGWEYVWHCHILSHEEMDFMHALVFAVPPLAPTLPAPAIPAPGYTVTGPVNNPTVNLTWVDNSSKEIRFRVERATDAAFTTGLKVSTVPANTVTFADNTVTNNTAYWYRVYAVGPDVGDTQMVNFPTMFAESVSNTLPVTVGAPTSAVPANPSTLTATVLAGPQVRLNWVDNATNETGFSVERCTQSATVTCLLAADYAQIAIAPPKNNTGATSYIDATVTPGNTYFYRVFAVNAIGPSAAPTNQTSAAIPAIPAAPTNFRVSVVKAGGNNYTATLNWVHPGGTSLTNFTVQRATNLAFTTGLTTTTPPGGSGPGVSRRP